MIGCRVLRLLSRGQLDPYAPGGDEVYSLFRQAANWPELLPPGHTFSIQARVASCSDVPSSMLVQVRGRDAICDSIRDARSAFCHVLAAVCCYFLLYLQQRHFMVSTAEQPSCSFFWMSDNGINSASQILLPCSHCTFDSNSSIVRKLGAVFCYILLAFSMTTAFHASHAQS